MGAEAVRERLTPDTAVIFQIAIGIAIDGPLKFDAVPIAIPIAIAIATNPERTLTDAGTMCQSAHHAEPEGQ